ncbi:hypothetical protein ACWD4G_20495 [Streptomyces sp. NPDC002643]
MTVGWGMRTARSAMFAAVCVLLAALGHVLMSGSTVPWWTLAAGCVATSGLGWCLAGRERGLPLVMSAVVLAQGTLHSVFSLVQPTATTPVTDSMDMGSMGSAGVSGMDHAAHLGHMAHGTGGGSSSFGMLAAHTLAAVLSGLWLGHGERAAFRVLRALACRLAAPLRLSTALAAPPPHWPRPRPMRERAERVPRLTLAHTIISRGPPAGTAVV